MESSAVSTRGPADAIGSALRVLLGVSGAASVSLWSPTDGRARPLGVASRGEESLDDLGDAAATVLAGRAGAPDHLSAVVVELPAGERALLLARDPATAPGAHEALLRTARPSLTTLLRRRTGRARGSETESETAAVARRLDRLRYDLHDGPQQEIHLLAQDLALFRQQLAPMIATHPDRGRALGRLDDLEAQLIALDEDLRRLSTAVVVSPLLAGGSLAQALMQVDAAFTARTEIVPHTELRGDVESLTDSQQIALLSLIREALANVRQHSEAETVQITISVDDEAITAEVRDDGRGFAPEVDGPRAAEAGRLGLVGMHERMRMLGGETRISSAPGGPTVVAASLPRWPVERDRPRLS